MSDLLDLEIGWIEVGEESSYGSEASSLTPIIPTGQPDVSENLNKVAREVWKPSGAKLPHDVIPQDVDITFTVEIPPLAFEDGASPAVSAIMKSMGFAETLSGDTSNPPVSAEYTRTVGQGGSMTVKVYMLNRDNGNWLSMTVTGVRCNGGIQANDGEHILLEVSEGKGLYSEWQKPDSTPSPPSASDYPGAPILAKGTSVSFGSINQDTGDFSIDFGNGIHTVGGQTADQMVEEVFVTQDSPASGSLDPRVVESSFDADGVWPEARSAGEAQFSWEVANNGNKLIVEGPRAQIDPPSMEMDDRYARNAVSFELAETAPGLADDLTIRWEATS